MLNSTKVRSTQSTLFEPKSEAMTLIVHDSMDPNIKISPIPKDDDEDSGLDKK
jgi:hypothetical protein